MIKLSHEQSLSALSASLREAGFDFFLLHVFVYVKKMKRTNQSQT